MPNFLPRSRALRVGVSVLLLGGLAVGFAACDDGEDSSTFPGATAEGGGGGSSTSGGFVEKEAGGPVPVEGGTVGLCGNGVKNSATEICDDGNTKNGDGCSATCRVEPGWLCPTPGAACVAIKCGDKIVAGQEDCDDGNTNDN